jgi:2-dehydro-3-deoxyphosphogluconate aldolase/(4S)-4-hydroxy-2-oxoglutarate aldolase
MTIFNGHRLIPTVTVQSLDEADVLVKILLKAQLPIVELTLRNGFSLEALNTLLDNENIFSGIGTITNSNDLDGIHYDKASFLVSPGSDQRVINQLNKEIALIPGIETASEILMNKNMGIQTMKFFPAELLGGTKKLKAYLDVFPKIKFLCTGGINASNYKEYLACENVLAVGGSFVLPQKFISEHDVDGGAQHLLKLKS